MEHDATDQDEEEPAVMGRPSTWRPAFLPLIAEACARGATDIEICGMLGISTRTLCRWRARHADLGRVLKAGKALADDRVERALFTKAVGYSFESEKIVTVSVGDGMSEIQRVPIVEHVPPDTTAAIFWLKNRRRDEWRDKHELEHTGANGGPIQLENRHELGQAMAFALRRAQKLPPPPVTIDAKANEHNVEDLA